MITFSRTLLVGAEFLDEKTLRFHGILEDNVYAMELQVEVGADDGRISRLQGEMKRYTTPVCPRAAEFLQKAVGISLREENWISTVNREVGQKGCQHFAEILIECGRCLDSALIARAIAGAREENSPVLSRDVARSFVRNHPRTPAACLAYPSTEGPHAD